MATQQLRELLKDTIFSLPWQTKLQPTLPAERVSSVLHEPAILGGYRVPHKPWMYYFFSLFQLHNETVNVWTHLIGCCVILHKMYGYFDEFDLESDNVLSTLIAFGISSLVGLFTSAMVHLVHGKSSYVHFIAFMVDYIGVSIMGVGHGVAMHYGVSQKQFYTDWDGLFLPCLMVVAYLNFLNLCLAKIWYGHDPHNMKRKYMFLGGMWCQAMVNVAPFAPKYVDCLKDDASCPWTSVNYTTIITLVFFVAAFLFAAHQPEKTWPGKFDIFGHGHQIFHVFIIVNHVLQMDVVYIDHVTGYNRHGEPNFAAIVLLMAALYAAEVLTLAYLKRYVPACLKRVEEAECHKDD